MSDVTLLREYKPPSEFREIDEATMVWMVITGILSSIILIIILVRFIMQTNKKEDFSLSMKYIALLHFIGNIIFCIAAGFFRTDLIFPINYNIEHKLSPNYTTCFITVSIPYIGLYLSKVMLGNIFILL